jgi:hypothetical protein
VGESSYNQVVADDSFTQPSTSRRALPNTSLRALRGAHKAAECAMMPRR